MAAVLADANVAQPETSRALFIKAMGAVLPNARIDFIALPGSTDVVTSDCSTERTQESLVGQSLKTEPRETDMFPDRANSDNGSGHAGSIPTGTPEPGTPEWTPRRAHAGPTSQVHCDASSRQPVSQQVPQHVGPELAPQAHLPPGPQISSPPFLGDASGRQPVPLGPQVPQLPVGSQISSPPLWCGGVEVRNTWYRVAYLGGINLRAQPSVLAAHTGVTLNQNDMFAVSAEIAGSDGRVYLRLADGRGWAFDDSALVPHDPSVVRCDWTPERVAAVELALPPYLPALGQVTNGCSPPLGQVASDCPPAYSPHVASGCPPAWGQAVGPPQWEPWAPTVWTQHYQ